MPQKNSSNSQSNPSSNSMNNPLLTVTKTKTRTKTVVIAVAAIAILGSLAWAGLSLLQTGVCDSGPRQGQGCNSNRECKTPTAVCVKRSRLSDLAVQSVTFDPTTRAATVVIVNQGRTSTPPTTSSSLPEILVEWLSDLGTVGRFAVGIPQIRPGATQTYSDTAFFTPPSEATRLRLTVDFYSIEGPGQVLESDETNNVWLGDLPSLGSSGLSAVLSGSSPISNIITGGSENVPVLDIEFIATGEAFNVRKLRIKNNNAENSDGINNLRIRYTQPDGTTAQITGVLAGARVDFNGLNFYIPQDSRALLQVMVSTTPITTSGISGDTPQFILDVDENFEAIGNTSGRAITSVGSADIVGQEMVLRKTKPTVGLSLMSPAGASIPGLNEVLRFRASADSSGDVVLDTLTFKVIGTDNGSSGWNANGDASGNIDLVSSWSLYEAGDLTTQIENGDSDWTLFGMSPADGTLSGVETVGYARLALTSPRAITAGTSKTYILKVDTTGASSSADDAVRFDIIGENGSTNTTLSALNEFQWDEVGAGGVSDINGSLVRMLPVIGNALVY